MAEDDKVYQGGYEDLQDSKYSHNKFIIYTCTYMHSQINLIEDYEPSAHQ